MLHGQELPDSIRGEEGLTRGLTASQPKPNGKRFFCRALKQYGQNGAWIKRTIAAYGPSSIDICIIKSMPLTGTPYTTDSSHVFLSKLARK